jgi:PEP-CTERM motif
MKVLALAAFLVALLTSSAMGLEVTSGFVETDLLSGFDIGGRLEGKGFSIWASQETAFNLGGLARGRSDMALQTVPGLSQGIGTYPPAPPDPRANPISNLFMTFLFPPITIFGNPPPALEQSERFDMTGFVDLFDPVTGAPLEFPLTGRGTVDASFRDIIFVPPGVCVNCDFLVTFTFDVPEPSTALMVALGGIVLLVVRRRRHHFTS